ncbi:hypothetical protein Sango_1345400 [Sesamum angolense]|uniref:Retrotransposon gag domain-containing protein n=1 Tax=Sesamum angolense TaxID=2727404 RepID=A0AAE1WSU6_9LAMI|nr:hypothetical protein Sango_1345400 [Sesamum angolense]
MQTRSRAREVHGVGDALEPHLNGLDQAPPSELPLPREQSPINGQIVRPREQVPSPRAVSRPHGVPPKETMIQLTQDALLALIHDASTRAAAQAMAQFAAQHPINPPPPSPRRSRNLSSAPEEEEQRQEEVNSRVSRPEVAQTQEHPFSTAILAEALPAGVKVSNLIEYDGTGDPQEHLDKFYAKIDWYDLSDAAYCKVFRTTLSKRALAWFNQLPAGTISSLEQLTQRFLHHFSMNKRVPKTAAFLFTIRQRENEPLFKESIAGKPPSNMENLLMRSQKYIRIEESNASDPFLGVKRKGRKEEKGEILVVAEQQGLIHQWPKKMKDNPKESDTKKYYRFHRDREHTTEECHHLMNEIEKLIQHGYLKEYINQGPSRQPQDSISAQTRNTDNLPTAGVIAVILEAQREETLPMRGKR